MKAATLDKLQQALGALDFDQNTFIHATRAKTVKGSDVVEFLDAIIGKNHVQLP